MKINQVLRVTPSEAAALRSALHIATRLAALLPDGYNNRELREEFNALHSEMVSGGFDLLPGTVEFSDRVLDRMREKKDPSRPAPMPPGPGWIVQYDRGDDYGGWVSLVDKDGLAAEKVYCSRNEAYRQMRERAVSSGQALHNYRVVPYGTPNGVEKQTGKYIIQYYSHNKRKWGQSTSWWALGEHSSALRARLLIEGHAGRYQSRYRVKYIPA